MLFRSIRHLVMNYAYEIRDVQKQEIAKLKQDGQKFSVTLDEWTSTRNRRYVNIYVNTNGNKCWNLGLVRVQGSLTSNACLELVREKLERHNLSLEHDIVALQTDGPAIMVKMGRISPTCHQQCFAHGIQLAVLDVLYKKRRGKSNIDYFFKISNYSYSFYQ